MAIIKKKKITIPETGAPTALTLVAEPEGETEAEEEASVEDELAQPLAPVTEEGASGTPLGEPKPIANTVTPFKRWVNGWTVEGSEDEITLRKEPNRPDDVEAERYIVLYMGAENSTDRMLITAVPTPPQQAQEEEAAVAKEEPEPELPAMTGLEEAAVEGGTDEVEAT